MAEIIFCLTKLLYVGAKFNVPGIDQGTQGSRLCM